jgi:chaperonin cofactor prefoldin
MRDKNLSRQIDQRIKEMKKQNLLREMDKVLKEMQRVDEENPTGPDDEGDPRIDAILAKGNRIQNELDPIMRELYVGNPAALAEWDEIMHLCDDLDEDDSTQAEETSSRKS